MTVREPEAAVIRQLAERFLAGEPITSLVRWLNENEIPTSTGNTRWRATSVRDMLRSGRMSGQREHGGQVIGPAAWPPIITPAQTEQIRAILNDPARRTNRAARRYLLAGLLRCHACGAVLYSNPRHGKRRYICKPGADYVGCGKTYIMADPVEELIYRAVLLRLDGPELAARLNGQGATNADAAVLAEQIAADQAQLEELSRLWAAREITAAEWKAARKPIEARQQQAKRRLSRIQRTTVLDGLVGYGDELRTRWATLNLNRQRAIIAAVLDHAVIGPGQRGGNRFDPARVTPVWRL